MKACLYRGALHYANVTLHTASSGAICALDTLWLTLDDDGLQGVGEVRLNIGYLHGYSERQVLDNVRDALNRWDWRRDAPAQLAAVHAPHSGLLAPGRMLLDMALHDLLARRRGVSLAQWLGADAAPENVATNQTLFWGDEERMLRQAESYVARGFTQLKLRTGVADFATDLARLQALRRRFGERISLAIDVNGQWSFADARRHLPRLQALGLNYVEQPLAPADDRHLPALAELGIPLMLDESLNSEAAIERLIEAQGRLYGHLKLVKLGGIGPLVRAGRRLRRAGIPFMVGQMNEGHVATAAALQVCYALQPAYAELYGADGLNDDPGSGLNYHNGTVGVSGSVGLGVRFDAAGATFLQEFE